MHRFAEHKLVVSENEPGCDVAYRYSAGDQDVSVSELIETYRHFRVRVIDTIFSKSTDSLKDFSNAFKLKRDEDES